jgi:hypothetical protein
MPATNRLSYGTAFYNCLVQLFIQKIYRQVLYYRRWPEPANDRVHAGLGASGNRLHLPPPTEAATLNITSRFLRIHVYCKEVK